MPGGAAEREPGLEEVAGWGRHPVVPRPGGAPGAPRAARGRRAAGRRAGSGAPTATRRCRPARAGSCSRCARADRILAFDAATGRAHLRGRAEPRRDPARLRAARLVSAGHAGHQVRHGRRAAWPATSTARTITATAPSARFVERLVARAPPTAASWNAGPHLERELFLATVGGMGLTGLIVEVTLRLRRVRVAWIVLETAGVEGLEAMLDGLSASAADWPYTVGWIDCLARGARARPWHPHARAPRHAGGGRPGAGGRAACRSACRWTRRSGC